LRQLNPQQAAKENRFATRRLRARESGLCLVCCTKTPKPGRSICERCNETARRRTIKRRKHVRQRQELQRILAAHEREGDVAQSHHLYEDAAQYYQDALNLHGIVSEDHARISEKLAWALSLGRNPRSATPLFDRALDTYLHEPGEAEKTVKILLQRARQLWIDARTEAAIPLVEQAVEVANASATPNLRLLAADRMTDYLIGLDRYEEAEALLNATGKAHKRRAFAGTTNYCQKAMLAAASGRREEAIQDFEQAINAAKQDPDAFNLPLVWGSYAYWATILGDITLAISCYERALLVARQYHIPWHIAHLCIGYASCLSFSGQHGAAYEYLLEALVYQPHTPLMRTSLAGLGIPIALQVKDNVTLAKCAHRRAMHYAFRSGEPNRMARTTAAIAQWQHACGRAGAAQSLLHEVSERVKRIDIIWEFPIAVARFGALSDFPKARRLIGETPAARPELRQACNALFDAFAATRNGLESESQLKAHEAFGRFSALKWHGYADLANTLLRPLGISSSAERKHRPFGDLLSTLTPREQQVAKLVLKGHTNHAIADMLSIRERTVEAHMTSIMSHLGVRSRHQLVEHLT